MNAGQQPSLNGNFIDSVAFRAADNGLSVEVDCILSGTIVASRSVTTSSISGSFVVLGNMSAGLFKYRVTYGTSYKKTLDFSQNATKKIVVKTEKFELRSDSGTHIKVDLDGSSVPYVAAYG